MDNLFCAVDQFFFSITQWFFHRSMFCLVSNGLARIRRVLIVVAGSARYPGASNFLAAFQSQTGGWAGCLGEMLGWLGYPVGVPPRSHKDLARIPQESDNGTDFCSHSSIPSWLIGRARWARWLVGLARWLAGWLGGLPGWLG